mgnify:CR=1 FL=1
MKNSLMNVYDKILLRKRAVVESVNNILKNQCQIEHNTTFLDNTCRIGPKVILDQVLSAPKG